MAITIATGYGLGLIERSKISVFCFYPRGVELGTWSPCISDVCLYHIWLRPRMYYNVVVTLWIRNVVVESAMWWQSKVIVFLIIKTYYFTYTRVTKVQFPYAFYLLTRLRSRIIF